MRQFLCTVFLISLSYTFAKISDDELNQRCKSCITVIDLFREKIIPNLKNDDMTKFKSEATKICSEFKENSPEYNFCYEIGSVEQSSQSLLLEVLQGLNFQTGEKKCKELYKKFPELCRDKYKIKLDWNNGFNPAKLPIKRLKAILNSYGVSYRGFTEKTEFVKAVEGLRTKTNEL